MGEEREMRRGTFKFFVATLAWAFVSSGVMAADWGDLTAKFIFDGTPPVP
jgi:hypothetical protein